MISSLFVKNLFLNDVLTCLVFGHIFMRSVLFSIVFTADFCLFTPCLHHFIFLFFLFTSGSVKFCHPTITDYSKISFYCLIYEPAIHHTLH